MRQGCAMCEVVVAGRLSQLEWLSHGNSSPLRGALSNADVAVGLVFLGTGIQHNYLSHRTSNTLESGWLNVSQLAFYNIRRSDDCCAI